MRSRAVVVLLALASLIVIAPVGLSFADTAAQPKEAKAKPQPDQPAQPAPAAPGKAKADAAARKAAEARMARCRLHPEICVQ
jgi:hypothetical protein